MVLLTILFVGLLVGLYFYALEPVSLSVVPKGTLYEGETVDSAFFDVKVKLLCGIEKKVKIEPEISRGAAEYTAVFHYGEVSTVVVIKAVPVTDVEMSYAGRLYAGDLLTRENLHTVVTYADGTVQDVDVSELLPDRLYEPYDADVLTPYGAVPLYIDVIKVKDVVLKYDKDVYPFQKLDSKALSGSVIFEDGNTKVLENFGFLKPDETFKTDGVAYVKTEYGELPLDIPVHSVKDVSLSYSENIYDGDKVEKSCIKAEMTCDDGRFVPVNNIDDILDQDISDIVVYYGDEITLKTIYGESKLPVNIVPVVSVEFEELGDLYEGDTIPIGTRLRATYQDATTVYLNLNDVTWKTDINTELVDGTNKFDLEWHNREYMVTAYAEKATPAHLAVRKFAQEFADADYSYVSDHSFVTIKHYSSDTQEFELAHIVIDSPSQLRAGISHDTYGGSRELPTDASKRLNWLIGINASMFSYETGRPFALSVKMKWGQKMVDSGNTTSGLEVALTKNGRFFQPDAGTTYEALKNMGVTDTFGYGDPAFLKNGQRGEICGRNTSRYPHTVIAMVKPGEYYFLTTSSGSYSKGSTYAELADFFIERGCEFGACLDGGGSSSMVFNHMLVNNTTAGGAERAVVDFIYIVDTNHVDDEEMFSPVSFMVTNDDMSEIADGISTSGEIGGEGINIKDEIIINNVSDGVVKTPTETETETE